MCTAAPIPAVAVQSQTHWNSPPGFAGRSGAYLLAPVHFNTHESALKSEYANPFYIKIHSIIGDYTTPHDRQLTLLQCKAPLHYRQLTLLQCKTPSRNRHLILPQRQTIPQEGK